MRALLAASLTACAVAASSAAVAAVRIDDFESVAAWSAHPADGVVMKLSRDAGAHGSALRVDFDFQKGGGYAVFRRAVDLRLPENYAFVFQIRGRSPSENLELKLVDSTDANVWWRNQRDFVFPTEWTRQQVRRRHIQFAWGPAGGGEIRHVKAIEFAVTAGSGGKGTVWIDDLELQELPITSAAGPLVARASSARARSPAALAVDGDSLTAWRSAAGERRPWLLLDFRGEREFGALVLDWVPGLHPRSYVVEADSAGSWRVLRKVQEGDGGRDWLFLPESEASRVRIRSTSPVGPSGVGLASVAVKPLDWAPDLNAFFRRIAQTSPRGRYPRGFLEQTYWTVVGDGSHGGLDEGLVSEDGAVELGKGRFSVEPFLRVGNRLLTWADVHVEQGEARSDGRRVAPIVVWRRPDLELVISVRPEEQNPTDLLRCRYEIRSRSPQRVQLVLAIRPFQVNPPTQFLNTTGGVAKIHGISRNGNRILVNGSWDVALVTPPTRFAAQTFDEGDPFSPTQAGRSGSSSVNDEFGFASAWATYDFDLVPGRSQFVEILAPLRAGARPEHIAVLGRRLGLQKVFLRLPDADVVRTLERQIEYVLINRDGPVIKPGSRSYDRSWIRDGALTSSALLRMGHEEEVRLYLDWFRGLQYDNGKVPCCWDQRGGDPVPEHDSSGELIFAMAEYLRYTNDTASARSWWPQVSRAVAYLDSLRHERLTPQYRARDKREFYGLLPPSISHEGYSAKPMHSYWDDFFALRGFKDAEYLARSLGLRAQADRCARIRREFERDLAASIRTAMARHKIDFVPGCADLGDFDATSTTIALSPVQADGVVPRAALERTFERYWEFFVDRRSRNDWDAYTPYEIRNVGAFVRLGWRDRAHELLDWFMKDRRPSGWAQWAEVVGREPREPRFIGDMPHTWVGSDFVRSVLDMIAYDRDRDRSLVVGAGVKSDWLEGDGLVVRGLETPYGKLDLTMARRNGRIEARVDRVAVPPGGLILAPPGVSAKSRAAVNGVPVPVSAAGEVRVSRVPATFVIEP